MSKGATTKIPIVRSFGVVFKIKSYDDFKHKFWVCRISENVKFCI